MPHPARQKIRLGDLLVEQKLISAAGLDIALAAQKRAAAGSGASSSKAAGETTDLFTYDEVAQSPRRTGQNVAA